MRHIWMGRGYYASKSYKSKVVADFTDDNGYIAFTCDVFSKNGRLRSCGCNHEVIAKQFPQLKKYLALHLNDAKTGLPMHFIANSLYFILNGEDQHAKNILLCTDEELQEIKALAEYGLHKTKGCWSFYSCSEDSKQVYANFIKKFNFEARWQALRDEFYYEYLANQFGAVSI